MSMKKKQKRKSKRKEKSLSESPEEWLPNKPNLHVKLWVVGRERKGSEREGSCI
jgi:hypothetical protein